jgi:hypothetical protein
MEDEPLTGSWLGDFSSQAPPPLMVEGNIAVPIEAHSLELVFEVDASHQRATGHGKLLFSLPQSGRPLLDLVPRPSQLGLNGQQIPPQKLRAVVPPDESTPLRMLDEHLEAGEHELEIEYPVRDATVQFGNGGARLGLFMTDLEQRGYLERHAPANLEFDQLRLIVEVRVSGNTSTHQVFSNGRVSHDGSNTWQVLYPDYFTCSSCYLHLTNRPLHIREDLFVGQERQVPITSYGEHLGDVEQALQNASVFLRELEETFGPYPHESLLVYCTGDISGGMEYAGATMTDLPSLGHEITHSWFARGVMPANGNAGWIDEAIARWRDQGYPRATAMPVRSPVNLAGFSPYRRHTPIESYVLGSRLLSELDQLFNPNGLRPLLALLFREKQRQVITTQFFQTFLEQQTGISLGAIFDRYIYGKSDGEDHLHELETSAFETISVLGDEMLLSPPPRAFTSAQLSSLL